MGFYLNPSPNRLFKIISKIFFLLLCTQFFGQENAKENVGSWMVFSMDNQVSEKWSIPVVGILCTENLTEKTEFGFVRSGLSYSMSQNLKFTMGAAYLDSQPLNHYEFETLTTQFWIYEEANLKTGNRFEHRFRLEHRWIDKSGTQNLFNNRLRYRLGFKQSLGRHYYVKVTDEPFFNFSSGRLDQNRLFLGVGKKIGQHASFEIGYFKTNVNQNSDDRIRVSIGIKTSFIKDKLTRKTTPKIDNLSK